MSIYSISDLEKLSGIKAHTLRIWEHRYGVIKPKRTETNIRYYTDEDLKSLMNICLLNKGGHKISKIAEMSATEVAQKVNEISGIALDPDTQSDTLTIAMIELDEVKFEKIISGNIKLHGFEKTMLEVINPFLEKLGLLWLTGSIKPAQEHFISNLIKRKILVAIDALPISEDPDVPKFLIYLPEGEIQELSLLFVYYLLRVRGFRVIYLGQNIPLEDIKSVNESHSPNYIFTMISEMFFKDPIQKYVDKLTETFPDTKILLSGYQVLMQPLKKSSNMMILESLPHFIDFLENIV